MGLFRTNTSNRTLLPLASNKHRIMGENKIIFLLFVLTILLLPKGHQAFFLPTEQKPESREKVEYSCFPWIFNPSCPLNKLVNWDIVCRTNTLGWEQCDLLKEKRQLFSQ